MVSHNLEGQKIFQDDTVEIIEEASKGEVEGLSSHAEVCSIIAREVSEEEILSWIRSVRMFKKIASKNKNPDIRNMLMARSN